MGWNDLRGVQAQMLRGENPDFYLDEENQRTVRGTRPKVSKRENPDSWIDMLSSDQISPGHKALNTAAGIAGAVASPLTMALLYSPEAEAAPKMRGVGKAAMKAGERKLGMTPVQQSVDDLRSVEGFTLPDLQRLLRSPDVAPPALPVRTAVEAPKEVSLPKRFQQGDKAGTYRGTEAFGGITPQKLGNMRTGYLEKMEEGTPGRLWYDESSADIHRWTGGQPEKSDAMANALAITSAGTGVAPNLMHANKGWNQYLVGDPVITGQYKNNMGKQVEAALSDAATAASGLKRSPFSAGLSVNWRGAASANRPTHDIHDVRAWGIVDPKTGKVWDKGVGEAGHRFLDEQGQWVTDVANARNLGGVSDWTPYRAQAAAWIAQKAAREGVPIGEAGRHYGSFAPEYQGMVTREWVPGDNTGHLPEMLGAQESTRRAYSDSMERVLRGDQGQDDLAREMGALSDTTLPNRGEYEGASNPGYASLINVGKSDQQMLDPASDKVMRAITGAHGLVGVQKQGAYNYGTSRASTGHPIKDMSMVQFRTGQPMTEEQLGELATQLRGTTADMPMVDPYGARALVFDKSQNKSLADLTRGIAEKQGGDVRFLQNSGDIMPHEAPAQWSSKPFIEAVEGGGPKMVGGFDKAMERMAPEWLRITEETAAKQGMTTAPFYRPMMEALASGGMAKLKELVKAGIVPVAAVAALGLGSLDGDQKFD